MLPNGPYRPPFRGNQKSHRNVIFSPAVSFGDFSDFGESGSRPARFFAILEGSELARAGPGRYFKGFGRILKKSQPAGSPMTWIPFIFPHFL